MSALNVNHQKVTDQNYNTGKCKTKSLACTSAFSKTAMCFVIFQLLRYPALWVGPSFSKSVILSQPSQTAHISPQQIRDAFHCTTLKIKDIIQPVAEVTSRRQLWFASSSALVMPATRRSSFGDRAFTVAGPRAWNSLPEFVTDCSSLLTFKKNLKTYLFSLSF